MGSGALCISCILRKENPAPAVLARRGRGCRLSLPNQFAFMRTCRIRGARADQSAFKRTCRPNVRRAKSLWKAVRLVWAVTAMRRTPRRRREEGAGSACPAPSGRELHAGSTRPHTRRAAVSMGSGASYNERRLLWKVIRFVFAVTGMRRTPRRRRGRGCRLSLPRAAGAKSMRVQPAARHESGLARRAQPARR